MDYVKKTFVEYLMSGDIPNQNLIDEVPNREFGKNKGCVAFILLIDKTKSIWATARQDVSLNTLLLASQKCLALQCVATLQGISIPAS